MNHARLAFTLGRAPGPIALLLVGGLASGGCASPADELVGTWRRTDRDGEMITFRADGTMQVDAIGQEPVGPHAGCTEATTRAGHYTVTMGDGGATMLSTSEDEEATFTETGCPDPANNQAPTVMSGGLSQYVAVAPFTIQGDSLRIVYTILIDEATFVRE